MGIDCTIKLPAHARINDVATVVGILAGLPVRRTVIAPGQTATKTPEGVSVTPSNSIGVAKIEFESPTFGPHFVYYFFEGADGKREVLPPSTAFWIAIGKRLVDFFGGQIVYRDDRGDASVEDSYARWPSPRKEIVTATDGEEWQALQDQMAELVPLTTAEVDAARPLCAYPDRQEYGFSAD